MVLSVPNMLPMAATDVCVQFDLLGLNERIVPDSELAVHCFDRAFLITPAPTRCLNSKKVDFSSFSSHHHDWFA
jgi:hypothetical protein